MYKEFFFHIVAMENYGLITYSEFFVLNSVDNMSGGSRLDLVTTICHEVAHQWIGNLVTVVSSFFLLDLKFFVVGICYIFSKTVKFQEQWSYLWLQEGFAQFMGYVCASHLISDYDAWTYFLTKDFRKSLTVDAYPNARTIEVIITYIITKGLRHDQNVPSTKKLLQKDVSKHVHC